MRVLIVGAGGVGAAVAAIARRRAFIEHLTLADLDERRAAEVAARMGDDRRFASALFDGMRGMGRLWQAAGTVKSILQPDLLEQTVAAYTFSKSYSMSG